MNKINDISVYKYETKRETHTQTYRQHNQVQQNFKNLHEKGTFVEIVNDKTNDRPTAKSTYQSILCTKKGELYSKHKASSAAKE